MAKTKLFESWTFRLQLPPPFDDPKYSGAKPMGFSQYNTSSTAQKANLTYKQFEAIQFRNQGYTNREIADLCGVGRKAIEKRFARIRKILSDYKEN